MLLENSKHFCILKAFLRTDYEKTQFTKVLEDAHKEQGYKTSFSILVHLGLTNKAWEASHPTMVQIGERPQWLSGRSKGLAEDAAEGLPEENPEGGFRLTRG